MPRSWTAEVDIDAPPDVVWEVLVDFGSYPRWNPFTREVRATLEVGSPVAMKVDMGPLGMVAQTETLVVLEPPHRIAWALDDLPRLLLWARRTQTLEALDGGRTRYRTEDLIGGALQGVVAWRYGASLERGFRAMAAALAVEVAARAAARTP